MRLPEPNDRQRSLAQSRSAGLELGLSVASYPIGGVIAYGLIGWLVGTLIHASWPIPAGMLAGLVIGTGYVIYRYGSPSRAAEATSAACAGGQAPEDPERSPR